MAQKASAAFAVNDFVVYPAHGVGRIVSIETNVYAGITVEVYVISYEQEKMTQRVPVRKAVEVGLRHLSSPEVVAKAVKTLTEPAKNKRGMWSKRAREYEQKINSGDLLAVAEVARDLYHRPDTDPASYSERTLYETAITRLIREAAAVWAVDLTGAAIKISAKTQKAIELPGNNIQPVPSLHGAVASPLDATRITTVSTQPSKRNLAKEQASIANAETTNRTLEEAAAAELVKLKSKRPRR
ncbi:hypothetical protein KC887_05895 [Candidatus Kaiserbacteria bacterium]|nr:hypothetical protein [Candidatus Kaiserbacteria bacterium]